MMEETINRNENPQLMMQKPNLVDLPSVELPNGYSLRHYQPGDETAWDRIVGEAFQIQNVEGYFMNSMRYDYAFRPERISFVCRNHPPVATASAWYRPEYGLDTGYLHMVGVLEKERGKGLGQQVSLACLHHMASEGRKKAVLQTDDYRIPAIKVYLHLGFEPLISHETHRVRWRKIFEIIEKPELIEKFAPLLEGPLFHPKVEKPDKDSISRYTVRHKWLPKRAHMGGTGGGEMDFMADESLYPASRLGLAMVEPSEAVAGCAVEKPFALSYTAGADGLREGSCVSWCMRGQSPLGFYLQGIDPKTPGYFRVIGPPGCEFEICGLGF